MFSAEQLVHDEATCPDICRLAVKLGESLLWWLIEDSTDTLLAQRELTLLNRKPKIRDNNLRDVRETFHEDVVLRLCARFLPPSVRSLFSLYVFPLPKLFFGENGFEMIVLLRAKRFH